MTHINNTSFYVEFLVGDRAEEPAEPAELVITSIGDRLLPRLRYRTGDIYRADDQPCACGCDLPVVRHEGRLRNMILVTDADHQEWVGPRDVDDAIGADLPIDTYRLHQHADGAFTLLLYIASSPSARPAGELTDRLRTLLGEDVRLAVESTDHIPSPWSGKFASCVSAVPPPGGTGG